MEGEQELALRLLSFKQVKQAADRALLSVFRLSL
jgi:hypothetical protein